jgi:O-antigen biosynthesis protein
VRRRPSPRALRARLRALARLAEQVDEQAAELVRLRSQVEGTWEMADIHARVRATMEWIALADVPTTLLISVITPTRGRPELLRRAIGSVIAQSYANWELLVVDDGNDDRTSDAIASHDDPRIRALRTEGVGAGAARNEALKVARGDYVVYLDDDDAFHPHWLRSVAWAADRYGADVMYGAILGEYAGPNDAPQELRARGPVIALAEFDRERLLRENIAGGGQLAHRRDLPEARWDAGLGAAEDWDLLVRLTRDRPALALPAIASAVTRGTAGDRITNRPEAQRAKKLLQERYAREG